MFEVDIDGSVIMVNDNESAVNNSSKTKFILNNKHSSIYYHLVWQNVTAGKVKIELISISDNLADTLTNKLTEEKMKPLFIDWTYWCD